MTAKYRERLAYALAAAFLLIAYAVDATGRGALPLVVLGCSIAGSLALGTGITQTIERRRNH